MMLLALTLAFIALSSAAHVPKGIGPGREERMNPDPGIAVKSFDSRWVPVNIPGADIMLTLRKLRLETSTMWFRIDCSDQVYERNEIEQLFEGGTVWVAAGQPKPSAPPATCLEDQSSFR
ncbi:MAG: hypothetical protein AAF449_25490 [Myxococcota bacterium]